MHCSHPQCYTLCEQRNLVNPCGSDLVCVQVADVTECHTKCRVKADSNEPCDADEVCNDESGEAVCE